MPTTSRRRSTVRGATLAALVWVGAWACAVPHRPPAAAPERELGPGAGLEPAPRVAVERPLMGTTFRVVVAAPDSPALRAAIEAAFDAVREVERWASDYDPASEVRRLGDAAAAAPAGAAHSVSPALAAHLAFALDVAARTGGAFDPTLGTLTRLWRRSARQGELPSDSRLAAARAAAGFDAVTVDVPFGVVRITRPGLALDLGGSAKGEGLDRALAALEARGFPAALVDGGGDVLVGAAPPGEPGWRVEVRPTGPGGAALRWTAAHVAIATSGDSERRVVVDGVGYAHIVDPATGLGLTARRAATVLAPDGRTADALATALVVTGCDGLIVLSRFPGVAGAVFDTAAPGIPASTDAREVPPLPTCATAGFPQDGVAAAPVSRSVQEPR